MSNIIRRASESSGVTCTPHLLRHSRAEHLRAAGRDPFAIRAMLGHATLDQTAHYVTPHPHLSIPESGLPDDLAREILRLVSRSAARPA